MKAFITFVFVVVALVGWVLNFTSILQMTADTPLGWVIGRIIGVFLPFIGAVLGYI
jgi:hypothetical protein